MRIDKYRENIFILCLLILTGLIFLTGYQLKGMSKQDTRIIGGNKDEHGCIGPAGYVWCQAKQKCIHPWEEACYESDGDQIKFLLAVKYGKKDINELEISFEQKTGLHALGRFRLLPEGQLPGKVFLAAKMNGLWVIAYTGEKSADCEDLKQYNFPDEMIRDICR